jgi:hypothetical protein
MPSVSSFDIPFQQRSLSSTFPTLQSVSRQKRDIPTPLEPLGTPRAEGDRELAMAYRGALLGSGQGMKNNRLGDIPNNSTFGQWWAQLRSAFQTPDVREWLAKNGVNRSSITIDPQAGTISFTRLRNLDPKQVKHTVGQDDSHWAAISGPIFHSAKVIDAGTSFAPPSQDVGEPVPWWIVGRFYQEPQGLTQSGKRLRAQAIEREQGFKTPDAGWTLLRSEDALLEQKAFVGDIHNLHIAASALRQLASAVANGIAYPGQIRDELKKTIELSADGSFQAQGKSPPNQVSLLQFVQEHGWHIPTNHEELANLADALSTPPPKRAPNGNLGGALAWPMPLDQASQEQLKADLRARKFGDVSLGAFDTVLEYLLHNTPISAEDQRNPRALIERLIDSPRGKGLAQAIQATFEARGVKGPPSDWLLAALHLERDSRQENGVTLAGYRLVSPDTMGKPASTVVAQLIAHLASQGGALTPAKAALVAHVSLSRLAPQFLVKDIPDEMVVGSHGWVSFTTAVARIEALSPGATATMSFAEVITKGSIAPINDAERYIEYTAQNSAIKEWAVANGMDYPLTEDAVAQVRKAFNAQILEMREASQTKLDELPTTKRFALDQLKKALPDMDPALFEEKCITSVRPNKHFPGPYSILDLFINGRFLRMDGTIPAETVGGPLSVGGTGVTGFLFDPPEAPEAWSSSSNQFNIDAVLATIRELPRPQFAFDQAIANHFGAVKKITSAHLKHLISTLPKEDQLNLQFGKITPRKEINYHRDDERVAEGVVLFQTERDGNVMTYELNRLKGTITPLPDKTYDEYRPTNGFYPSPGKRFDVIKPKGDYPAGIIDEVKGAEKTGNPFDSNRTRYIVDTMIEDMNLPGVQRYAKGVTTFDTEKPLYKTIRDVLLNMIPFWSATENFIKGKLTEGFVDLAFDIFGFMVGLGSAAQGAKGLAAGASALAKAGQTLKIVGRAAVGALNPVSGVDDLLKGLAKGVHHGAGLAYKGVKQLKGSYRSINLLELAKKPDIAEGTFRAVNKTQGAQALGKFDEASQKWYPFDPITKQAYGKPLENFVVSAPQAGALQAIGSADVATTASRQHGLAASGTFKVGGETVQGDVIMFQGNWHQYDAVNKRAFGPPLKDFTPGRVAANGEVRLADPDLVGYEAKYIAPGELSTKGLQGNVYVGRSQKEYVKVDATLYESQVKDGQRVVRHPTGLGPDIPVSDLGAGWAPTSRSAGLLGGAGGPVVVHTPWRLGDTTFVVPMDDIKVVNSAPRPFKISYKGRDHDVAFNSFAGVWKETNIVPGTDARYFWRSSKGKWQRGTFTDFKNAKKIDAHHYNFIDVSAIPKMPINTKPVPKDLHYFWGGQDMPGHLIDNISKNAAQTPGYKSIVHVDADSPEVFELIKTKLESKGITVMNFKEDELFKQLKRGEMYDFFRQGHAKNLAVSADIARYPIMYKYGGIYLDADDVIRKKVDDSLTAAPNDLLLGPPLVHKSSNYKPFYNNSNFATRANNPVINDIITEMNKRFTDNKAYFSANRPKATRGPDGKLQFTPEFEAYAQKIFETTGPTLLNDTLKKVRPDMYDLGLEGFSKDSTVRNGKVEATGPLVNNEQRARQLYASKGIEPPELLKNQIEWLQKHHYPLRYKFEIAPGSEHSWAST